MHIRVLGLHSAMGHRDPKELFPGRAMSSMTSKQDHSEPFSLQTPGQHSSQRGGSQGVVERALELELGQVPVLYFLVGSL